LIRSVLGIFLETSRRPRFSRKQRRGRPRFSRKSRREDWDFKEAKKRKKKSIVGKGG